MANKDNTPVIVDVLADLIHGDIINDAANNPKKCDSVVGLYKAMVVAP